MDHLIAYNHASRNPDAVPFVTDEYGNRKVLPYHQPIRVTRSEAGRILSHFAGVVTIMEMKDWLARSKGKSRILVLRSQGIGDIILLTPALRKLAKSYDEVHVGVRQDLRCVVEHAPYVTKVYNHDIHGAGNAPLESVDFMATVDANMWAEEKDPRRHLYHRTISFSKCLQVELADEEMEPDLWVTQAMLDRGKEFLPRQDGKKYCAVQPVGSHSYRNYWMEHNRPPYVHHLELIQRLEASGWTPVILCHYQKLSDLPRGAIDLQGRLSLEETLGVLNQCDACVGFDSGLLHCALALGVPTVGMFSICSGKFRFPTYKAEHKILQRMPCCGCGDFGMSHCKLPNGIDGECTQFPVEEVVGAVNELHQRVEWPKIAQPKVRAPATILPGAAGSNGSGLWMTMMFQDESKEHMQRFADRVISHAAIEHVIAVDGGCETGADEVLRSIGKVEVHRIPYCNEFWNAQAHQRNACFAFVRDHQPVFFMDPDEAFSEGLSAWLKEFPHLGIEYGLIARATWDREEEAKAQGYRPPGTHNWPDWQPRFYRWRQTMKFHGAAHHITLGCPEPTLIQKECHVLHFEEEAGRRGEREAQWKRMMSEKAVRVG